MGMIYHKDKYPLDVKKEQVGTGEFVLVHKDVFMLDELYFFMHEYMIERGFCTRNDSEFGEKFFNQRDSGGGAEIWAKWRLNKQSPEDPIYSYEMDIDIHMLAVKKTEVVMKGKKMKMDSGEVEVKVIPRLILNSPYAKHWFFEKYYEFFRDRVIKKKYDRAYEDFVNEINRFFDALRQHFHMETLLPEPELGKFYKTRTGE